VSAAPSWRVPLLAAAVTLLLAAVVCVFAYQRLRDDAEDDAARGAQAPALTPGPSASADASGARPQPPAAPLAPAAPSR
jgi:hypothetical protein